MTTKTKIKHTSIILIVISAFSIIITDAITKKSDDGQSMLLGVGGGGNQPVYHQSNQNGQYSMSNQYGGGGGGGNGVNSGGGSLNNIANQQMQHEHVANGQQSQSQQSPQGSQSNLYYYYYPVQDQKSKDQSSSSSSQYGHAQMISSGHPNSGAAHENIEHGSGGPMDAAASGSEISYSAPELSHNDYQSQSSQNGFDAQTLSNLAQQFQQQYFNNPSGSYESNAAANMAAAYGNQAEASSHLAQQIHPGYSQGHLAFAQGSPYGSGQHSFAGYGQGIGGGGGAGGALQPQSTEVSSGGLASGLKKYGLSSILMPVLAIAGLSLLLPTMTNLGTTTTKTKRSIDDSPFSSYIEKMDAYYKMYNKAMEKEECMNRMICELGDAVSDVRGRSALLMVVENIAPQWMEKKMTVFKNGALSKDMTKCKKYSC
ncbi:hypothetical protein DERP_013715 [Dermatophagoides pteronyssinus]|uniref:Filaggrin-2-like n=1 Tax=Dermatophagoides pteronyssinus TaxID=6956 RepID=A0ABQ8JVA9_DERPT|nr:hypothetical protein DERP_013715 [Dermatophagoides pteronyssinus]